MDARCPFCSPASSEIFLQNSLSYARWDYYPVGKGHLLIVPFRHLADFFELTDDEQNASLELLRLAKAKLDADFCPSGYNVGVNVGESAGQTVMHVHVHLIPRYQGDVENPEGGVRGVIPDKRVYRLDKQHSGGLCDGKVHSAQCLIHSRCVCVT